jgi:hypothetical protein
MSELSTLEKLKAVKDKIVLAFAEFNEPTVAPVEQADSYVGKMSTGEDVKAVPTLEVGSALVLVSAEGELPVPDGSYTLEDGASVDVTNGVISSVSVPEAAPEAPSAEAVEMAAQIEAIVLENTALKQAIEDNKVSFEAKLSAIENKLSKQLEFSTLLQEGFVALAEVPAVTPLQAPRVESVQMSDKDIVRSQMEKFEKLKSEKYKKK